MTQQEISLGRKAYEKEAEGEGSLLGSHGSKDGYKGQRVQEASLLLPADFLHPTPLP